MKSANWGNWVLERARTEMGDLYPLIPDPKQVASRRNNADSAKGAAGKQLKIQSTSGDDDGADDDDGGVKIEVPFGMLLPLAYLWARTVKCKNPNCGADVPLFGQLWLRKKKRRAVHLRLERDMKRRAVGFEVCECDSDESADIETDHDMSNTATVCPLCQTTIDAPYIRGYTAQRDYGQQLMAVACRRPGLKGKVYISPGDIPDALAKTSAEAEKRLLQLYKQIDTSPLDAQILPSGNAGYATGKSYLHGIRTFRKAFSPRQLATLLALTTAIREAITAQPTAIRLVIGSYLSLLLSQSVNRFCALTRWNNVAESVADFSSMKRFALSWDWPEVNPWSDGSGNFYAYLNRTCEALESIDVGLPTQVARGSATDGVGTWPQFDAVITDPPYYDNESYAELSDMFYVWLRITAQELFQEHLATENTPKKREVIAAAYRQGGNWESAERAYLEGFEAAAGVACKFLKDDGLITIVYAHKTTAGWATLISAVRRAGFLVCEAWPLDTEKKGRAAHQDDAALASSIFLVARKRDAGKKLGNYEDDVQPELQDIVRERVETLWEMGIAGADLVIACVGAGLRAFTKYEKVEYANGEEVPAEKFLAEVEGVVLDSMMDKLSGATGGKLSAVDAASRFYVLWRFVYKAAEIDAGEAIVFTYAQHVELDGPGGLSDGKDALVEKKKAKYRARDFTERGDNESLGLPDDNGKPASLIDTLHRVLWLMENSPRKLPAFLDDARPDRERLRVLAQALAGAALSGKSEEEAAKLITTTPAEQSALGKLLANWRSLIESRMAAGEGTLFKPAR